MKDSTLKDRIFEELLIQDDQTCEDLATKINVTVEHVFVCAAQMSSYAHVKNTNIDLGNDDFTFRLKLRRAGRHFYATGGYGKQSRVLWWEKFPSRYWWLIAIFSFVFGNVWEYLKQDVLPKRQTQLSIEPKGLSPEIRDTASPSTLSPR